MSKNKDTQDVSHILSLEITVHIQRRVNGPPAVEKLRRFVNNFDNMRMVNRVTNHIEHRDIDIAIINQLDVLTRKQETRARQQVKYIQVNHDICPEGFFNAAREFYRDCQTRDGTTLWDMRRE